MTEFVEDDEVHAGQIVGNTTLPASACLTLRVQVGCIFPLDAIVDAHRLMENNKAGSKIVVLP